MTGRIVQFGRRWSDRPKQNGKGADLACSFGQLLELVESETMRDEAPMSGQFCEQMARFRVEMASAVGEETIARIGADCVELCRQYFAAKRAYLSEREAGFQAIIHLLRESLDSVAAESGLFAESLSSASERVIALASVDDLQVLKQRLTHEVTALRRVVVEKQQKDKAAQEQLAKRIETLESTLAETRVTATIDPVTQVSNRGHFDRTLQRWIETSQAAGKSFVLALIDLDNFKGINDTHGHQAGDHVLLGAAQMLAGAVRPCDFVARYGGDEFALLMANMTLEQAERRLPEIVARIARFRFPYDRAGVTETLSLTISCGLAELSRHDTGPTLLERADEGLYAAKRQGRNCAVAKRATLWRGKPH